MSPVDVDYNISDITTVLKGKLICNNPSKVVISDLATDSRNLGNPETSLFFALTGKRHDGHLYLNDVYRYGVRNFVISSEEIDFSELPDANFIVVKNTLTALQQLAAHHRSKFNIPVIGITGSNGKTIIKEWLYQLLFEDKTITRSPKSYNSQVGVPLSVWQLKPQDDIAIFEAGISEPEEMGKLQPIIRPTIGIFTNIGQAHDENFIHLSQKVGEKLNLFTKVDTLIYCADYYDIKDRIIKSEMLKSRNFVTWAHNTDADYRIKQVVQDNNSTLIQAQHNNQLLEITIPFTDAASIENAIHCWITMLFLGYTNEVVAHRIKQLSPVAMRLELKEGVNNCSIINDSYSSDLKSLVIALDFLNQQKQHIKRTVILSDILQSGRYESDLYSEVAEIISQKGINRIIGIGKCISRQEGQFKIEKSFYASTKDFLECYSNSMFSNETILIKGARIFEFEQISKVLQQKAHETVLEINLNSLTNNLNYYKSLLKPTTKVMAMVKAFSYGSGGYEIANVLQFNRVDYLAVAYADEGMELRKTGITMPIMVMNPDEQSFDKIIQYDLEPEIYSFRIFELLKQSMHRRIKDNSKTIDIHLKLDSGMHRLGFEQKDISGLIKQIKENPSIRIKSIFSHLAASDEPELDDFTNKQISIFKEMSSLITKEFDYPIMLHILNSAGICRFVDAQFDMIRLGLGLYGIANDDETQKNLSNVSTLRTIISQIKHIQASETIGYGRKGVIDRDSKIATISIGYADGISRRLGNGNGKVLIAGREVPIIGNICMDMCMVDITELEGVQEGDEVIIFGADYPVNQMAKTMGTIPYEVFTSLSRRIKRVYYQE